MPVDMTGGSYEAALCWIVFSVDTRKLAKMKTTPEAFSHQIARLFFPLGCGVADPESYFGR